MTMLKERSIISGQILKITENFKFHFFLQWKVKDAITALLYDFFCSLEGYEIDDLKLSNVG